ncbi:small VCP interacting protein [Dermatophagoides pteronyssinus]|uniref:Uncharacterized protein n=2 Tax=Dermatophagoides pteronyssinus TaxID=6956 RepID=A0ABQ8ISU4_DERPT|nr:uncharacterized protein LOC113798039 [Dermatophagoides pteronyssinus]KAH9413130.1 hypothetical protein DERP_006816 [Dermatophagoides pteronyssinus]
MGSLCCGGSQSSGHSLDENSYLSGENITEEERRRRAVEAAEKRLQQQQMRGVQLGTIDSQPIRVAHSEIPGNIDSNLRWQVS